MSLTPMLCKGYEYLDSIVLKPNLSLSLSSYNRQTGTASHKNCISFSTGFTALQGLVMLSCGAVAIHGAVCYHRYKMRKKLFRTINAKSKEKSIVSKS